MIVDDINSDSIGDYANNNDNYSGNGAIVIGGNNDEISSMQQHLQSMGGIRPSRYWLNECVSQIRSGRGGNGGGGVGGSEEEQVWAQILHADLRHVVRELPRIGSGRGVDVSSSTSSSSFLAAKQLREAIFNSMHGISTGQNLRSGGSNDNHTENSNGANSGNGVKYQSKYKATLPTSFQMMVQLEEVMDATMNLEQQLASMGTDGAAADNNGNNFGNNNNGNWNNNQAGGPNGNNGNRNPKYRCFKMVLSDGYYSNGSSFAPESSEADEGKEGEQKENDNGMGGIQGFGNDKKSQLIMAMETSPVQNLSLQSLPGTKLLLHSTNGPITVRFGMVQLNDSNVTVIGGNVADWKEVWKKARQRAQREKGHGVDPTIKALIWNPLTGDEDAEDEGEGASGDVTAPPPVPQAPEPPPPQAPQPPRQQAPQPSQQQNSQPFRQQYQQTQQQQARQPPQQRARQPLHQQAPPAQQPPHPPAITPTYPRNSTSFQNRGNQSFNSNSSSSSSQPKNLKQSTLDSFTSASRARSRQTSQPTQSTSNSSFGASVKQTPYKGSNPYQRANASVGRSPSNASSSESDRPMNNETFTTSNTASNPYSSINRPRSNIIPNDDSPGMNTGQCSSLAPSSRGVTPNPYASLRPSAQARSTASSSAPAPAPAASASNTFNSSTAPLTPSSRYQASTSPGVIQQSRPPPHNSPNHIDLTENPKTPAFPQETATSNTAESCPSSALSSSNYNTPTSGSRNLESLSFVELKELMQKLRTSRSLYEKYYGKTFEVPCKMTGVEEAADKHFNIAKAEKGSGERRKSKGEKKYEFVFASSFLGPKESYGKIAIGVKSSLIEPYFGGQSPGDIRKQSRADKQKANKIVNTCTTDFVHDCSSLSTFYIKLTMSPKDFFEKNPIASASESTGWLEDVKNPLLVVVKRA